MNIKNISKKDREVIVSLSADELVKLSNVLYNAKDADKNKLFYEVKDEIQDGIGVYVVHEWSEGQYLECVKKPKKMELKIKHEKLMFSFMQSLSREYAKHRKQINDEIRKSISVQ